MANARLKVSKDGVEGYIKLGVGPDHSWQAQAPIPWLDGVHGFWVRRTTSTKFSQMVFIELVNERGKSVMRLKNPPYNVHDTFTASLMDTLWIFETSAGSAEVFVEAGPPPFKTMRIRETWGGSLTIVVGQGEACGMEIQDPATGDSQTYIYKGVGISFGLPIKKLPSIPGSGSSAGPWNEFDAPGWMAVNDFSGDATLSTIYNVGMGTSYSSNVFDFAGGIDGNPQFLIHLTNFSTGRTFSLPSVGFSSGSMKIPFG